MLAYSTKKQGSFAPPAEMLISCDIVAEEFRSSRHCDNYSDEDANIRYASRDRK